MIVSYFIDYFIRYSLEAPEICAYRLLTLKRTQENITFFYTFHKTFNMDVFDEFFEIFQAYQILCLCKKSNLSFILNEPRQEKLLFLACMNNKHEDNPVHMNSIACCNFMA